MASKRRVRRTVTGFRKRRARGRRRWIVLRRAFRAVRAAPPALRVLIGAVAIVGAWGVANGVYQTVRKPAELFFPVSDALAKSPSETWRRYGPLFSEHSTVVITPELLAALAQIEGGGNPVARTYWRWRPARNPFEVYQPASSAVGMYQITNGTFHEAKRYCIRDHVAIEDGPGAEGPSCWFNSLYTRVVPSHAIEMTAALLDRRVARTLERRRVTGATLGQKQNLAAIIHLCGAGAGDTYVARGFQWAPGRRCGDHDVGRYVAQVNGLQRRFVQLAAPHPAPQLRGEAGATR